MQVPNQFRDYGYCRSLKVRACDYYDAQDCPRTCKYATQRQIDEQRVQAGGLERTMRGDEGK